MKPAPFDYVAPDTLDEALELLAARTATTPRSWPAARAWCRCSTSGSRSRRCWSTSTAIPGLDFVRAEADGGLALGAMTRQRAARARAAGRRARAAPRRGGAVHRPSADPQPRHPRRQPRPRRPGGGAAGGRAGARRPLSGWRAAAASAGSTPPTSSPACSRPRSSPTRCSSRFDCRRSTPGSGCAFLEVARRHGDYALVGVAVRVALDDGGRCRAATLAFLSVGEGPVVARRAAEDALRGERPRRRRSPPRPRAAAADEIDPVGRHPRLGGLPAPPGRRADARAPLRLAARIGRGGSGMSRRAVRLDGQRRAATSARSSRACCSPTSCATSSASPAPTSAASTASAAPAPSCSTASRCAPA